MAKDRLSGKLAVILHADIAGSTALVQQDEQLAHERIQDVFRRFNATIEKYQGHILELRGDALLAQFERASDAVTAALSFQADHTYHISRLKDDLRPTIRVGIAMGEVVIADNTVTGAGVVLAQRVEQLAAPGGLCITAALHESLPRRMPFDLEDLGDQVLKGFDDPVHVYRVELSSGASIPPPQQENQPNSSQKSWYLKAAIAMGVVVIVIGIAYQLKPTTAMEEPASIEHMAFPLPDKPSIAVLPFTNISGDVEQEYFADGMTENLITDLSKIPGLFVIARNSSFSYKGQHVKVRQVAEELGVRYVMEGSVQRAGDQVRINAQLIDATTGGHLWADRYDGSMADVFALQDKVTEQIVKALALNIKSGPATLETASAQAYDAFLKGWASYQRRSKDDLAKAIPLFETAVNLDEGYTQAHTALAAVYWEIWQNQWAQAIGISRADAMQKIKSHLQEAMQEPSPLAHRIASNILIADGNYETAAEEAEKIIALDSNDASGYATLASALALSGKTEESKSLLAKAERLDPFASRLHAAVLKGETDTVRQLIAEGVPVDGRNHQGRTALHLTAFNDHAAIAKLLIEAGADIEKPTPRQTIEFRDFGSSPLALTAARGSSEVAKLLIAAGADVNARSLSASARWAALHYAAVYGHADVAKLLIDSGAAIDVLAWNAQTPIYMAILNGDLEMVELLIEHGGEVNTVNDRTRMPLHAAIQSRDMKIVQLLIAKGVDVNARTTGGSNLGESALHISALTGYVKIAELLLINGARIDAPDQSGYTPLRRSIDYRNTDMAKLLISKGADITTRDVYGISLLHVLAQSDDVDLAALLIDAGVDVNARDKNLGFTPLDYAQGGDLNMIELLKRHGSICTTC